MEHPDFVLAIGRVSRRQLNHLTLSPYQRGLISQSLQTSVRDAEPQDPALVKGMEYTGAVGAMVMDELAFCYKRTEEGIGRAVQGVEASIQEVDDRVDVVMRDVIDITNRTQTLEMDIANLKQDLTDLTQRHNNLLQDYQVLDHNSELLQCAMTRVLRDVLAQEAALPGGRHNPIEVDDNPQVAVAEAMPWEEVEMDEEEVEQEVVMRADAGPARLVPIKDKVVEDEEDEEEGPLEPRERDLPQEPAPPYVP